MPEEKPKEGEKEPEVSPVTRDDIKDAVSEGIKEGLATGQPQEEYVDEGVESYGEQDLNQPAAQDYGEPQPPPINYPQPAPNYDDQRLRAVEGVTGSNQQKIEYMAFKSDLDDRIHEDSYLRKYRPEALESFDKYAKQGQVISAEIILNLLQGAESRKLRAESRSAQPNLGNPDIEAGGAAPEKDPSEMTLDELREAGKDIRF